jgi:hypothetical protein
MKKYSLLALVVLTGLLTVGVSMGFAQDEDAVPKPVEITVDGTNYCLLCELSADDVADANSTYATMNALKVTAAVDADGNLMEGLEGKTLHYLPTKAAEPLLVGEQHAGASVTVVADYYADAAAIKVKSFEAEDSGWDDLPVGTKSNLQVL